MLRYLRKRMRLWWTVHWPPRRTVNRKSTFGVDEHGRKFRR